MPTRRTLLRVGGVAIAGGLAGCHGPGRAEYVGLAVAVDGTFDTATSTVAVPARVTVTLQAMDSSRVAARGVSLVLFDEAGAPVATRALGDFSYREAPEASRRTEDVISGTAYMAEQTRDLTVEAGAVPAALGFTVESVALGGPPRSTGDSYYRSGGVFAVPTDDFAERTPVRAEGPHVVAASVQRYVGPRPVPATVGGADYEAETVGYGHPGAVNGGEPATLAPTATPTPSSSGAGTATNPPSSSEGGTPATPNGDGGNATTSAVDPGTGTSTPTGSTGGD